MNTSLSQRLKRPFAVPYGCFKLASSRKSILRQSGWFESVRSATPSDHDGNAVPWMNYSIVELLADRIKDHHTLFEYGSGYSTRFFAQHAGAVTSIEYEPKWFEIVADFAPANAQVLFAPLDESRDYVDSIKQGNQHYHVVVVDGRRRVECMKASLEALHADGVVLLDDSDREQYQSGFEMMKSRGFRSLSIGGMKPGSSSRHQTTIFYRDGNCFGI